MELGIPSLLFFTVTQLKQMQRISTIVCFLVYPLPPTAPTNADVKCECSLTSASLRCLVVLDNWFSCLSCQTASLWQRGRWACTAVGSIIKDNYTSEESFSKEAGREPMERLRLLSSLPPVPGIGNDAREIRVAILRFTSHLIGVRAQKYLS